MLEHSNKSKVMFIISDKKNEWMVKPFVNSLRKFHSEEELPLIIYDEEKIIKFQDPQFFYRAKPRIAKLLKSEGYDLIIGCDVDQIITGDLSYIWDTPYDVGTVYNWNRVDPMFYGEVGLCTIQPTQYYNCGLVAMRDERFINNWWKLCNSSHFDRMPMREQGFLNILCHYGDYNVVCFDDEDKLKGYNAWHGLRSKGEWNKVILIDGELLLPPGLDGYPDKVKKIKVLHWAGGADSQKLDYRLRFNEQCIKHLDYLTGDSSVRHTDRKTK